MLPGDYCAPYYPRDNISFVVVTVIAQMILLTELGTVGYAVHGLLYPLLSESLNTVNVSFHLYYVLYLFIIFVCA